MHACASTLGAILPLRHLNRNNHLPKPPLRVRLASVGAIPNHASSFCFTRRPLTALTPSSSVFKFRSLALPLLKESSDPEGFPVDASPNHYGPFHSEKEARELFESWCRKYHKTYSSEEQKLYRFGVFKENLECATRETQTHVDADVTLMEMCERLNVTPLSPPEGVISPNPRGYLYSETKARELFEIWCKKHGRTYSSEEQKLYRFSVFKQTLERHSRHFTNVYADLSSGERMNLFMGCIRARLKAEHTLRKKRNSTGSVSSSKVLNDAPVKT